MTTIIKKATATEDDSMPLIHKRINKSAVNTGAIEAMTRETDKMVYGTFVNIECQGQPAKISCKYYKGQEYFCKVMEDNQMYRIPLSVARHINERCVFEPHTLLTDANGQQIKGSKKQARYKFMIEVE